MANIFAIYGPTIIGTANQVVKTNTGGTANEYGLILNANVDAAAAIAGTKIDPNFGAQAIVTTASISTGGTVATTGTMRFAHGSSSYFRNNANGADIAMWDTGVTTTDRLTFPLGFDVPTAGYIGTAGTIATVGTIRNGTTFSLQALSGATTFQIIDLAAGVLKIGTIATAATQFHSFGTMNLYISSVLKLALATTGLTLTAPSIAIEAAQVSPSLTQAIRSTATTTGETFLINAQDCSGTTVVTAGSLSSRAGNATGGSGTRTGGNWTAKAGTGATANGYLELQSGSGVKTLRVDDTRVTIAADVRATSLDTSGGIAPTGGAVNLLNSGKIRWAGFSSGSADVYLNSNDSLLLENVNGDQFDLGPRRSGSIAQTKREAQGAANTTDATVTTVCTITLLPNYKGYVELALTGMLDGSESTNNYLLGGSTSSYITDGSTITLCASNSVTPVTNGSGSTWGGVSSSTSGLILSVKVQGVAATNISWEASVILRMRA